MERLPTSPGERPAQPGTPFPQSGTATAAGLEEWAFQQSPCAQAIFDADLRVVRANAAMERALARTEGELRGLRPVDVVPGAGGDTAHRALRAALETGEPQCAEVALGRTDPRTGTAAAPAPVLLTPLYGPDGRVRAVCMTASHGLPGVRTTAASDTSDTADTADTAGLDVTAPDAERERERERVLRLKDSAAGIGASLDLGRTVQELGDVTVPLLADLTAVELLDFPRSADEAAPVAATETVVLRRAALRSAEPAAGAGAEPEARTPGAGPGPAGHGPAGGGPAGPGPAGGGSTYPGSAGARATGAGRVGAGPADTVGGTTAYAAASPPVLCLATGRPVRYSAAEPAFGRWLAHDPGAALLRAHAVHSLMAVPLQAHGSMLGVVLFGRSQHREPFGPEDVLVAEEIAARAAISIHNARRHTRARTTTMALQRSLLPQTLPDQTALDIASRYLPAGSQAGVGGDWFDVIPLSGARVALVVGDVVGHGIRASATMGRVRTAVRTLADVDLPADELLTHLDDLVLHLSVEEGSATDPAAETAGGIGTTCLYAVYDPVTRRCTLARAGHPPPAVVTPDGAVRFLDVPPGPPLGLGGLPFEAVETELPEGSVLALYTDGLLEARDHDIDEALDKMFAALARPAGTLDAVCDRVLTALLTHRPDDDVALLVARTRALHADRVATWDLDFDTAVVSEARQHADDQLVAWGLEDAAFVTELMVSELVTNAIRYGRPPIQLRMIHQGATLICEVFDSSSTTPHMRRARTFDEGGRGLLLVAQLAQRWGTRHDRIGKTVWAEQSLAGMGGL
ncbi:SpoIIE family protein phosphatase [Streptomyces sp. NPDC003374]